MAGDGGRNIGGAAGGGAECLKGPGTDALRKEGQGAVRQVGGLVALWGLIRRRFLEGRLGTNTGTGEGVPAPPRSAS
jgi:hypothetical protein